MNSSTDSAALESCISACLDCHRICLKTTAYCMSKGGKHVEAQHLSLMLACADICQTSANAMLLGTSAHRYTCRACADVCAQCAESCGSMGADETMKRCAETCRRCADSCRKMAA